jgi:hypothetical protein
MNRDVIPTYDQALQALKTGDEDTLAAALFAFEFDDGYYVGRVTEAVRALLHRADLTPQQIVAIGRALHGLGRMPLRTPGLDIHISLANEGESGAMSYDLILNVDRFSTDSGGYVNAGFGSDSVSGIMFAVESSYREYTGWAIAMESWPDIFGEMQTDELSIQDDSDEDLIDWDHPDGWPFWEWIEQHG